MNSTSANRAYLALAIAYAQIPLWGTSDTPQPLSEIGFGALLRDKDGEN